MKKISFAMVVLLVLALAAAAPAAAGNKNQNGGDAALTDAEKAGLLFVREEEKLARDVYLFLLEQWDLGVFATIAASEEQHMAAVYELLVKYGLNDPVLGPGLFENQDLQDLYDKLTAQGVESIVAAIEAGITIEETDIADLGAWLVLAQKNDIIQVYTNLQEASYSHLEAFEGHLP